MSEQHTVCPHCGTEWPSTLEMRFCGECGSKLGALSPEITRKERRTLTVLFADISGFTSFAEDSDPEEIERVVDALLSDLGDAVESYGGYVDKFLGDAVMAVFGAPEAHEDDPLRAVRTGLEMLGVVETFNDEHGESLSLSVGVNTGEVLWSQVGGGDYTVTGDAVNVAKRLERAAGGENTVLVSQQVRERAGNRVQYARHDAISVEGRETPVRAFVVEGVTHDAEYSTGEVPLCGRDDELAWLLEAYEAPEPSFLAVTGPAGIGKSRLQEAFRQRVAERSDTIVLGVGHCSQHVDVTLEPLGDVLLSRAGVGRGDPNAGQRVVDRVLATLEAGDLEPARRRNLAHLLAASAGLSVPEERLPDLTPDQVEAVTRRAWQAWLRALASEQPVVLGVEDLQWADDTTRELLSSLRAEATAEPGAFAESVTVVTTLRPEGTVPEGFETIRLRSLAERDARTIARATLGGPVDGSLPSFLQTEAGGNPYFVVELLRYLRANDLLERTDDGYAVVESGEVSVPDTLDGLLVGLIDALAPGPTETLKGASVVGKRFWADHLAETLGRDVDAPMQTLLANGMVHPREESTLPEDREFVFKHALLRDAAYSLLPRSTRVELHGGVAAELAGAVAGADTALANRIASHYEQAEQYEQAVEWYRRAGDHAADTYASDDAIAYYEQAIALARTHDAADDATVGDTYAALADVELQISDYEGAVDTVADGKAVVPEGSRALCRLLGAESRAHVESSSYENARESASRMQEIAAELGADGMEAEATRQLGLVSEYRGEYDRAREYYEKSLGVATETGDRQAEVESIHNLGVISHRQDEYDRARELLQRGLELTRERDDRFSEKAFLIDLGLVAANRSEYDRAREYCEQALEIAREIGDRKGESIVVHNLGEIAHERGEYDRARERYQRSLDIERELGNSHGEAFSRRTLADVAAERGNYERAREQYRETLAIARELESTDTQAEALGGLGVVAREQGEYTQAQQRFDRALQQLTEIGNHHSAATTRLEYGLLALERGDVETARDRVQRARETLAEIGATHDAARSRRALGAIAAASGSPEEARKHLRTALEQFEEVDAPHDALATLERLVEVCREAGDTEQAREWCRRAEELLADAPDEVADRQSQVFTSEQTSGE